MKKLGRGARKRNRFISFFLLFSILAASFVTAAAPLKARAVEANAVNEARYAVVRIMTVVRGDNSTSIGLGSGFGVGSGDGYADTFLTNWHVVTGSGSYDYKDAEIYILLDDTTIFNYDSSGSLKSVTIGNAIKCEVLYAEQQYPDVAVLKTDEPVQGVEKLPLRRVTQSLVGQTIYTIGYPASADATSRVYTSDGYTETIKGSVSAVSVATGTVSRCLLMEWMGNTYCVEHDAHINNGNSGGPLVLSDGSVIGINTYGYGADSDSMEYSVSIYIDYAIDILDELGLDYALADDEDPTESGEESTTADKPEPQEPTADGEDEGVSDGDSNENSDSNGDEGTAAETGGGSTEQTTTVSSSADASSVSFRVWIAVGAGVLVLAILIAVLLIRGKKKQDRTAASAKMFSHETECAAAAAVPGGIPGTGEDEYRLQGIDGAFAGRRFRLEQETYIGRTPGHPGIIYPAETAGVSGSHCVIRIKDGKIAIADLNSTYGTFVNGSRLKPNVFVPLFVGDTLSIGSDRERFRITRKGGVV